MVNNNEIYSVNDVMELLKVSRPTVHKWIRKGELKAAYLGNQYRIRQCDLDSFLDSKRK